MNVRTLGLLTAAGLATGCMTTTMHRAQSLGAGNYEVSIEPGISGVGLGVTDGSIDRATVPTFWVTGRYGVTDRIDVGGRLGSGLFELHTSFMLTNPDADVRVALSPYGTPLFFSVGGLGAGAVLLNVPVLIGIPVGESELTLGPGLRTTTLFAGGAGTGGAGTIVEPTISVGFSAQLGDTFRLHPEFGIAYGAAAIGGAGDGAEFTTVGASRFSFALGFQVGSPNRTPSED